MSRTKLVHRVRAGLSSLQPRAIAVRWFTCPLCRSHLLVRLTRTDIGVRCLRCAASAVTLSLVSTLLSERPGFRTDRVYELSARGPLYEYLRREVADLTVSEYFDDVPPGEYRDGVQCQDVHRLTHPSATFDLVTSTEVFEHVADDRQGFAEVRRVLRPGGRFIFTVPLADADHTVTRAELADGEVRHLLPAEYHGDRIRGQHAVLVFRDYGRDITDRLVEAGFSSARIEWRYATAFLGSGRGVVVASA